MPNRNVIRKDNIRLQKEAEAKANQREKEIAKAEAERKVIEEKGTKKREKRMKQY